jgi:alpha-galactosidase
MKYSLTLIEIVLLYTAATAQQRVRFDESKRQFVLENQLVQRVLQLGPAGVQTVSFTDQRLKNDYVSRPDRVKEITFTANGIPYSGRSAPGFTVTYKGHTIDDKTGPGSTLRLDLQVQYPSRFLAFDLSLFYQILPDLPLIRKWTLIKNTGGDPLRISELEWENLNLEVATPPQTPGLCAATDLYVNYGRVLTKPPYVGRTDDAAILLHDPELGAGVLLGNEAPAIMKRTHVYRDSTEIGIGMGFEADEFSFRDLYLA